MDGLKGNNQSLGGSDGSAPPPPTRSAAATSLLHASSASFGSHARTFYDLLLRLDAEALRSTGAWTSGTGTSSLMETLGGKGV